MPKTKQKQHVCLDICQNEQGFTFLNMLMTIAILLITLPLLSFLLKSSLYSSNYNHLSVQQFFHFIQNDVILSTDYSISNNEISLELPNDYSVSIKKFGRLIHRQVDGRGHEIYLRDIQDMELSPLPYGFIVKLTMLEGDYYEKTITFYE